jgi:hypothetical protein
MQAAGQPWPAALRHARYGADLLDCLSTAVFALLRHGRNAMKHLGVSAWKALSELKRWLRGRGKRIDWRLSLSERGTSR